MVRLTNELENVASRLIFIYVRSNNYPDVIRFLSRGSIMPSRELEVTAGHEEFTGDIPIPHTHTEDFISILDESDMDVMSLLT